MACFTIMLSAFLLISPVYTQGITTITTVKTGTIAPTSTPSLSGNAIAISQPTSGPSNGQIEIFLSPDLQRILQATLDNECKIVDDIQCAQFLFADINNARVDSTSNLQGRTYEEAAFAATLVGAMVWEWFRTGEKLESIKPELHFDPDKLLQLPEPATAVVQAGAFTVTLAPAKTTETSSVVAKEYVIIPTFSPKVSDKVPDIVARQWERVAFEGRAALSGIALSKVLIDDWIDLWTASLTPMQLAMVKGDPIISWVVPNAPIEGIEFENYGTQRSRQERQERQERSTVVRKDPHLRKKEQNSDFILQGDTNTTIQITRRATVAPGWSTQRNARRELHSVSSLDWAPVQSGDFDYINSAGSESIIYVVERNAFFISHAEFDLALADVDGWIYPQPANRKPARLFPMSPVADAGQHATAVLSKIVGKWAGAAKKANIVGVMIPYTATIATAYSVWRAILQDAVTKKAASKGKNVIINYSGTYFLDRNLFALGRHKWKELFAKFDQAGILLVFASGNDIKMLSQPNPSGKVCVEQETGRIFPDLNIVMAGHTNEFGWPLVPDNPYSNVWGIGELVSVPNARTAYGYLPPDLSTGSSYVAPVVSSLVAMFHEDPKLKDSWGTGNTLSRRSLDLVIKFSEIRHNIVPYAGVKPLIYNLAHEKTCPASPQPRPRDVASISRCIEPGSGTYSTPTSTANLPVITSGSNGGECKTDKRVGTVGINSKPIDKNTLQKCLLNLDVAKWHDAKAGDAVDCDGMVSFQSNRASWDNPEDCHNACKNCLSESINDGVNQVWCDAWAKSAHCWEGYVVTPPPLVTDGTPYEPNSRSSAVQTIVAKDYIGRGGKYLDMYAVQDCIRHMDASKWLVDSAVYDCKGIVHFDMYSFSWPFAWDSPSRCWNAIKNCLSDAVNTGASEAFCEATATLTQCRGGFYPR